MARKRASKSKAGQVTARLGERKRSLYDAAQIAAEPDVAKILAGYREVDRTANSYRHRPRASRIVAELEHLLTLDHVLDLPARDRAKSYLIWLKDIYRLPRFYRFYPRDHVPAGGRPYDEEVVRVEHFGQVSTSSGLRTFASGFASFNAGSGVFTIVGYSMGTDADLRGGPIVTLETDEHPADITLTANFLLDHQYQLSASINPAFQPGFPTTTYPDSVDIDLMFDIHIRNKNGASIFDPGATKRIKRAELHPDSSLPRYVAGTQDIASGSSMQGSAVAVPISFEHTISVPANCRVQVGAISAAFVVAGGYRGGETHRYLGVADGRASGQVTSIEAMVFT
jgi:hypothetical protein